MIAADGRVPIVSDVLAQAVATLGRADVPEPRADAEVLLAHVLGTTRAGLVLRGRMSIDAAAAARFDALVAARRARRPIWHLLGRREFWSLDVAVDARVLTPRPETELLVERVLAVAPHGGLVVDVGTGSGAIAVAVASERPDLRVVAVDVDRDALVVAAANRHRLAPHVRLARASWLSACAPGVADVVVSNPPYVLDGDVDGLMPEVRDHEPRHALVGGADGLRAIREVVRGAAEVLKRGGTLVLEIGAGQADAVVALLAAPLWEPNVTTRHTDLAGIERCVCGRRGAS